jgi:GT2 family glycosyltransferase
MSAPMIDLSIIVVTWKSLDFLKDCIASIAGNTAGIAYEIIVVDNASGDGSEQAIREQYPHVLFIASATNLGFAKANNLGMAHASGKTLLFLNPDTEVRDNALGRMVAALTGSPAGAAGARLLNSDGSLQTSCVQTYPSILNQLLDSDLLRRRFPRSSLWGMSALFQAGKAPSNVDAISGACFMVKREVFQRVGGFTESYFMYVEDLELSYKITKAGFKILYLPDCEVVHHGGKSSAQQSNYFVNLQQKQALVQFFLSTKGEGYAGCYRALIAAAAVMRMMLVSLSFLAGPLAFRGTDRKQLLGKWSAVFRWAAGFSSRANAPTSGMPSESTI